LPPLVWRHGAGAAFWLEVVQLIVFGAAAVTEFRGLRATGDYRKRPAPSRSA
jgi:hypothetical protein